MKANVYFSEAHYFILLKTVMSKMGYLYVNDFDYLKVNWIIF